MALLCLIHIIAFSIWLAARKRQPNHRTAWLIALWFSAFHLVLGIYLAINGVDRPKTIFTSDRNL